MHATRRFVFALTTLATLSFGARAEAASLTGPISGWASGVPTYISMYEYVPAKLATNPPILVVSHYCSGSASGVFGEAQTGGIVAAADQYGFIMIFPQTTNNCWDVGSTKSLTRDGGGDTQAIAEMVTYSLSKHGANKDRVYAVGTSSGAMMTQALLAIYPDVFKAGAEFAGVPAGCWAASYSASNQWSGPCANGQVTHTAQEWGDLVRAMDPGYMGRRPRVELWHGLADSTISPTNLTESIKEWTNVLGLPTDPTKTATVMLANHSWTRQTWQDSCGFAELDAWSEDMGPHGTDANLNAMYVIPFLGLDQTGATDPEQCGTGGMSGSAGSGGQGAASGAGGRGGEGGANLGGRAGSPNGGSPGTNGGGGTTGGSGGRSTSVGSGGFGGAGTAAGASTGAGGSEANSAGRDNGAGKGDGAGASGRGGQSNANVAGTGYGGSTSGSSGNSGTTRQAGDDDDARTTSGCACSVATDSSSQAAQKLGLMLVLLVGFSARRRFRSV
jgi:poly(hydroxyalkanoate) depolymerase family esterase